MTQTMGGAFIPEVELEGKTRPFWSVIVPIYQRTKYLKDCLNSILDQDPGADDMEIIVTDDASPSDLSGLVHELGRGRVEYRRNPTMWACIPIQTEPSGLPVVDGSTFYTMMTGWIRNFIRRCEKVPKAPYHRWV